MTTQIPEHGVPHPYVERKPGVQGGRPVIRGHRFPISSLALYYRQGMSVEEILREFPTLSAAEVFGGLAFYYDNREEIDKEIFERLNPPEVPENIPNVLKPPARVGN